MKNIILLWTLAICQLLDGILTYIGITHFGTFDAEGNPLIKMLMHMTSGFAGLLMVKSIAIFIIFLLSYVYGNRKHKLSKALLFLTCVYLFAVILWLYVLGVECGINLCVSSL
jgi:hypothetical protein